MIAFELFELYVSGHNIVIVIGSLVWIIKATVENSIYDVAVGIIAFPITAFLYDAIMGKQTCCGNPVGKCLRWKVFHEHTPV
jgi:hypothetical protein